MPHRGFRCALCLSLLPTVQGPKFGKFNWRDPLDLQSQLSEDELQIQASEREVEVEGKGRDKRPQRLSSTLQMSQGCVYYQQNSSASRGVNLLGSVSGPVRAATGSSVNRRSRRRPAPRGRAGGNDIGAYLLFAWSTPSYIFGTFTLL